VQGRRDREWRQCAVERVAIAVLAQQTALQHALGQFLDEQWHAVGAIGDLVDDAIGQCLASSDLRYQSGPVAPVQPIERQHADLRLAGPGHLELGAERHDKQYRQAAHALNRKVEQLARGRVNPMGVFEDHDHRLLARQTFELPDQRFECPLLLPLGTEVRQRVMPQSRQ